MRLKPIYQNKRLTGHEGAVFGLCFGESSEIVYSAGGDGWIVRWDLQNPDPGVLVAKVDIQIYSLKYLSELRGLVAGNMYGGLHWIDLDEPSDTKGVLHHAKGIYTLADHGGWLYSGGGEGLLTRWSIKDRCTLESIKISHQAVRSIALFPEKNVLAAGCSDGRIILVYLDKFQVYHIIEAAHTSSVFSLAFSSDGRYLWSGGRDAYLKCLDLEAGYVNVFEEPAHWFTINALALDPTGKMLASASRDKTIRIWDTDTGTLLQTLESVRDQGHRNSVNNIIWSPWNNTLVSASDDRSLILWFEK